MSRSVEVRPGVYRDSVTLLQLSQALLDDDAVRHAQVSMGTSLNLDLLNDAGYERPQAGAEDLVIAVHVDDPSSLPRVEALVDHLLSTISHQNIDAGHTPPKTLRTAIGRGATVALISVPGEHAFREAIDAIEAGAHPIVFSDNVSIEHEILLKERAEAAGLLAMGPDCGTVVLDGVGVGFANAVTPGPVGLVSASGTGAQQVCAIADHVGIGVRHVIGLGGRDLTDDVGGLAAFGAIRLLDSDPAIEVVGIVAKTIGARTEARLTDLRRSIDTPSVLVTPDDLTAGTAELLATVGAHLDVAGLPRWNPPTARSRRVNRSGRRGRLLGLYSGGTLAAEAQLLLGGGERLEPEADVVDLGDDRYTRGRPHPMIDSRLRIERLLTAERDDHVGAIVLDVVLGHGAAADPAADLGPTIAESTLPVVVALIGTTGDPQGRDRQATALAAAGATVFLSNAAAVRHAARS